MVRVARVIRVAGLEGVVGMARVFGMCAFTVEGVYPHFRNDGLMFR